MFPLVNIVETIDLEYKKFRKMKKTTFCRREIRQTKLQKANNSIFILNQYIKSVLKTTSYREI